MKEFAQALYSHFNTVNDLNTALNGQLYPGAAQQGATFPYGTYHIVTESNDFTFSDDYELINLQVSVYSDEDSPDEIHTLYGYLKALFDDAALAVSGYRTLSFQRTEVVHGHDEEMATWHYHVEYEIALERDRT